MIRISAYKYGKIGNVTENLSFFLPEMFPFHRHIEALEVGEVGRVGCAFHHAEVVEFPSCYIDFVGGGGFGILDFVNQGSQILDVFAADVGLAAYGQACDILPRTSFL